MALNLLRILPNLSKAVPLALALLLLPCTGSRAQDPAPLDLRHFLELVEAHNPELTAVQQQREIATAEAQISRAYPNPEIDVGAGPWRSRIGGNSGTTTGIGISQAIELPSVRATRIGAAMAGIASAEAYIETARLTIGYHARLAYGELLRRQADERISQENAQLLDQIRDRVLKRVSVGEAPRFELVRADAEALVAQNTLATARLRVEEARAMLRYLTANALPPHFVLRGSLPEHVHVPTLSALHSEVIAVHPALRNLGAERDRARQRLEYERALRAPQPAVRLAESGDPEMRSTTLGVTFSVPLWNRREGQIAQARANIDLANAQLEQQRLQLLREVDSAHARVLISQRQIETFEAGLLRSAETALQVVEAAYRFGERGFIEVLDAQRTLRLVRSDYNQARFDRFTAWLDIDRLRAKNPFEVK